ncbi:hypothetical protein [Sphingobacterium multivorum]|uniref:hypothetical protein n=1 Tax=Sphingobacterium multivorum TaxID=28454 RepID=UPI0028A5C768|nr:hypothetical protein [Sphingobacterium multivorum]
MISQIVIDFNTKLSDEALNQHTNNQDEIIELYDEILHRMSNSYEFYRENVATFLSGLEGNNAISVNYEIAKFLQLFEDLMLNKNIAPFDESIINHKTSEESVEKLFVIMKEAYSKNNQLRLSEDHFDFSQLTYEDVKAITALLVNLIYDKIDLPKWDKATLDEVFQDAAILRPILECIQQKEFFYHTMGVISEKLSLLEYYQLNRDIAEEVIICSFNQNEKDWGYLHSFRVYSNGSSIHAGLLYANLSMTAALKKTSPLNEKYLKEIIMQSVLFFRKVDLSKLCEEIYELIPAHIHFRGAEKRYLDHTKLNTLLLRIDPKIPLLYLDYLNEHRESVLSGNLNEALPCLIALYNIKKHYPSADFSGTGLGYYLSMLELIVPKEYIGKQIAAIYSDTADIKGYLKDSLIKLEQTRNSTDFIYDNDYALKLSSAAIEYSLKSKDHSAFLMGMILKSDYSLLFQSQLVNGTTILDLPEIDINALKQKYANDNILIKYQNNTPNSTIIWLAVVNRFICQMSLHNGIFEINKLEDWAYSKYHELAKAEYFYNLLFTDTFNDRGNIRSVFSDEHEAEGKVISDTIGFTRINTNPDSSQILIVKDMHLSQFPHNLLLDNNGEFIAHSIPVTNILSTEWFLTAAALSKLPGSLSKSIWIPTESEDYPLNILYSKIEDSLANNSFNIFTQQILKKPLDSDINIICSHGAKNISESQIVYQNNEPMYDLDNVIGNGKILIFFVCYSGSMQTEFFRNNVTSLIKKFIRQGYQAVIAPFWTLEVSIPGLWLPEFLSAFEQGKSISEAVFLGNQAVYKRFPTPAAWACLHLYGNPNLRIDHHQNYPRAGG